jgi:hypothetical protein
MIPRPPPSRLGHWVRLSVTLLIALHVAGSAWLVIQYNGKYTEGDPSPSEIHGLMVVDKDETLIDIKVERATPLMLYMFKRDSVVPEDVSNESSEVEPKEETNYLDDSRNLTLYLLAFLVISEILIMMRVKFSLWIRAITWFAVLLCFALAVPLSYMADLGDGSDDQFQEDDGASFVHRSSSSELSIIAIGFQSDIVFSGYDLGLVTPSNRTAVIEEPPEPRTEDAESWIELESRFSVELGKNLQFLFLIPLLWYILPSLPIRNEEENSTAMEESE